MESAGAEAAISQQGSTQVSQTDQGQRPVVVDPEDMPQGVDQLLDAIADARMAELAEKREILADLRILDREGLAELAARDGLEALALIGLELPQVETHPPHNGLGGHLHSRGLALGVAHLRVSLAEKRVLDIEYTRAHAIHAMHAPCSRDCNDRPFAWSRSLNRSPKPAIARQGWGKHPADAHVDANLRHLSTVPSAVHRSWLRCLCP